MQIQDQKHLSQQILKKQKNIIYYFVPFVYTQPLHMSGMWHKVNF